MFYDKRTEFLYKLTGSVIYSFIDDFPCLYYLVIVQKKLSGLSYKTIFEKRSSSSLSCDTVGY